MFRPTHALSALALMPGQAALADMPMVFDVAEDRSRIFMADAPLHENALPERGAGAPVGRVQDGA
ncbi:MAG: hypothetical protein AAGA28_19240 [Pseudomonadota bacterium]